jgi:hypothetical protein
MVLKNILILYILGMGLSSLHISYPINFAGIRKNIGKNSKIVII